MSYTVKLKDGTQHEIDVETVFTFVKVEREYGLNVAQMYEKINNMSIEILTYAFFVNLEAHKITDKPFLTWLHEDFDDFNPVEDDDENPKDSSQVESTESS